MQDGDAKVLGAQFWDSNPCGGGWEGYSVFMEWIRRTEPYIYDILRGYQWQDKVVVEVGCGQGATLNYLPELGAKVIGLDISRLSLEQALAGALELRHEKQVFLAQSDAECLPLVANCVDRIVSVGVLHHTPDTDQCIDEIHRVLRPGGEAIVMLYRTGNPKWWATRVLRAVSSLVDRAWGRSFVLADVLRSWQARDHASGTAWLGLFGVPILKAFSNEQAHLMFSRFSEVRISNHQPGFRRLTDLTPVLGIFGGLFGWLDQTTQDAWGFYQVIQARKCP